MKVKVVQTIGTDDTQPATDLTGVISLNETVLVSSSCNFVEQLWIALDDQELGEINL